MNKNNEKFEQIFQIYFNNIIKEYSKLNNVSIEETNQLVTPYFDVLKMIGMYDSSYEISIIVKKFIDANITPEQWKERILKLEKWRKQ